jgi:hypothetical protein
MGPDIVMAVSISDKLLIMLSDVQRHILHLVKLFPESPIAPLHPAVELRPVGRIQEQQDLGSPASLFELVHELRAAIDLDGFDPKRKLRLQMV